MKTIVSIIAVSGVLLAAGCQQNSSPPAPSPDTNSTTSEVESNAVNTMDEVKSNVVMMATNAYMTVTNAVLTNSPATNSP